MNINFSTLIPVTVLLMNISACSYVKTLFPDKGKDYQYTTEIAPLILPDDLKNRSSGNASESKLPVTSDQTDTADAGFTSADQNEEPVVTENSKTPEKISVELVQSKDDEYKLTLGVESTRAWRMVSKALSRKSIEVTNRNQDENSFVVQYDPEEKNIKDGSLWDEVVFIFGGFQGNEKEYALKLQEHDRKTDVIILDDEEKPLSNDSASLKLLTTLQETINADLANK